MNYLKNSCLLLALALIMGACSDDPSSTGPDPDSENEVEASKKQFVYNGMNEWYLYQQDVDVLADDYFADEEEKKGYLEEFSGDAEALYDALQSSDDRFSFFIEDYEEYEDSQEGIQAALGLEYGYFLVNEQSGKNVGYVRYVVENSPADEAGLERYDVFTAVDGTDLRNDNIIELLSADGSHTLTMAETDTSNGGLSFPETEDITVQSDTVREDPIYLDTTFVKSGTKIGYLMYNAFQGNSHEDLNTVFGDFISEGIDELVLDLRYNGGGAVITSQTLASMISGLGSDETYAKFTYNEKKSDVNNSESFLNELPIRNEEGNYPKSDFIAMNKFQRGALDRVFVLTTRSTASASEALINSLQPYNIEVIQIGTRTLGKDVGSITLYDAPPDYTNKENINEEHKIALQPIVVKIRNSAGKDYPNGIEPEGFDPNLNEGQGGCPENQNDNCVSDLSIQTLVEKPAIGDPEDPLLSRAISIITGQVQQKANTAFETSALQNIQLRMGKKVRERNGGEMYIEPFMMPKGNGY